MTHRKSRQQPGPQTDEDDVLDIGPPLVRLTDVAPDPDRPMTLAVTFDDGRRANVSLAGMLDRSAIMAPLRDPAVFNTVQLGPFGAGIEWPGQDLDLSVETLQRLIAGQDLAAPMDGAAFTAWQDGLKLTAEDVAGLLGISRRTVFNYRDGTTEVPLATRVFCRQLAADPHLFWALYQPRAAKAASVSAKKGGISVRGHKASVG